ncbi:MAG: PAS domain S-box protein, partial [Sedimentisphaerales bacterium]|nr:PAS domain S-box protein [Sedimentisphaerales bacterium]
MNKLLRRQIKKFMGDVDGIPDTLEPLFAAISDAYDGFDSDRCLIEHALDISSEELRETNQKLSQEVVERKEAQKKIKSALSLLTATLESTADGILVVDLEGKVVSYNSKFLNLWSISDNIVNSRDDNELLSFVLDQLIDPERFLAEVRRLYASIDEESCDFLKFKDGRVFERFSQPQKVGDKIVGRVWSFRDITERIKAEEALRESERRLNIVLNSILTGVVIIDAETHSIIDINILGSELIGLPKKEIIGQVCHEFICPAEKGQCPISDLGQTVDQSERTLIKGDGTKTPILKTVAPISWQGRSYFVESFIDISGLKEAIKKQNELLEQIEKTNKELKDFAYIVSHDLKAPLRGIKTIAEWIIADYSDKLDEDGKEQLQLLSNRVERMHNLVDGVLQYSKVGRVQEEQVQVNLRELVPDVIDMVSPPENISITIENELPVISCEQTRIMQVFQNLISNAIKYIDKPEGWIKIGCIEKENRWVFSVSDNGPGIEERHFDKIFQIFQTLSSKDEVESTGVGLTVTQKIVELYGGRIWVESTVGQGSTFFFSLPK